MLLCYLAFNEIFVCKFGNDIIFDLDVGGGFYKRAGFFVGGYAVAALEDGFRIQASQPILGTRKPQSLRSFAMTSESFRVQSGICLVIQVVPIHLYMRKSPIGLGSG